MVLPVKVPLDGDDPAAGSEERFAACACNVGDSLAYVYSPAEGHVRELTQDSHDIQSNRDMRDALGALGPVDGRNPELREEEREREMLRGIGGRSSGFRKIFFVTPLCEVTQSRAARRIRRIL